jgi:hypothetical protein
VEIKLRTKKGVTEMKNLTLLCFVCAALGALASPAGAEPYWHAYEGNDYPENEGWSRRYRDENGWYQGGAERTLENGVLTLDTRRSDMICDYYSIARQMDPDPGETFVAEWRLNLVEANRSMEIGVWIARDDPPGEVVAEYWDNALWLSREHWSYAIEPHVFHTYRIESSDMVDYSFWVDGEHVHDGAFYTATALDSFLMFGDPAYGGNVTSVSQWDYVRFGVVPEPASFVSVLFTFLSLTMKSRR